MSLPLSSRVVLTVRPASAGRFKLGLSKMPPSNPDAMTAIFFSRGVLPDGWPVEILVVSDPSADPSLRGLSAYDLARQDGYGGTLAQWLATLKGADGLSAYQLARAAGYGGTETQWLASLKGTNGINATTLLGNVTVSEANLVTLSAGLRRVTITTPTAWNVKSGDDLLINAVSLPSTAYALHDVIVTGANTISVGVTVPLLSVLSTYTIPARLRRLN